VAGHVSGSGLMQRIAFAIVVRPFLVFWVGVRVTGRENLPEGPPYVIIANHSSHLDTVVTLGEMPLKRLHEIRPVAAADYFARNGLVYWVTRTFFNILPIPRSGFTHENNPLQLMKAALDEGSALLLFPEGTRITDDEIDMQSFRSGVSHLVEERPDVPIVPVWIEGTRRSMPKGTFIPVPLFCELHIGRPRTVSGSRAEIVHALEQAVLDLREN
jgi:1-acyl-sn-glycerol-3-phosphate acyltransferase